PLQYACFVILCVVDIHPQNIRLLSKSLFNNPLNFRNYAMSILREPISNFWAHILRRFFKHGGSMSRADTDAGYSNKIKLVRAQDGSGVGAAIIAAITTERKKRNEFPFIYDYTTKHLLI
ncbi:hypothetical protein PCK1_001341, partial [Pneumocystis canis]